MGTPFGAPVVPDVNARTATSPGRGSSPTGTGSGSSAASGEQVVERRFVEDEPGAGEPGDAVPRGHGLGGVERHDRRAQPQDGEVGDHEGEGRPGDEHDGVTPADAPAPQTCRGAPGDRVEPLVGDGVAVDLDRGAVAGPSSGGLRGGGQRARGQVPEQRRRIARATEVPGPRPHRGLVRVAGRRRAHRQASAASSRCWAAADSTASTMPT